MDKPLTIDDHFEVKSSLENLDPDKLQDLGGALGLRYPKLKRMRSNILDDMPAAWLNKEDNVLDKSGEPTWNRLAEALEKIGQLGVAEDIKNKKCSSEIRQGISTKADGNRHRELEAARKSVKERNNVLVGECKVGKGKFGYRCLKFLITILMIMIVICSLIMMCVFYTYWPTFKYHFNLDIHSKSLPYLPQNFVGREKEMKEVSRLVDFRDSDVRIVNIYGSPGFGKSTLAMHVGHKMVQGGVTVDYVNTEDFPDKDVKTALAEKILETSDIVSKNITFERLLRWARERYSSTLVILDNCDDLLHKKKEEFHQAVEKVVEESLDIKIILTSRKVAAFLMYFECYRIMELSTTASYQLLERKVLSQIILTTEEKEQIADLTGNVPLALQVIGSILNLPASPTPRILIDELKRELIETLSPADLPIQKQVFTVINISYKYLPKEQRRIGCQLTIFPGSFTLSAAFAVCNSSTSQLVGEITSTEQTKKFSVQLKSLVRNSLLEHSQRTDRYQYHRLIKEYFLLIQRRHWPNEAATMLPAFHIYYILIGFHQNLAHLNFNMIMKNHWLFLIRNNIILSICLKI